MATPKEAACSYRRALCVSLMPNDAPSCAQLNGPADRVNWEPSVNPIASLSLLAADDHDVAWAADAGSSDAIAANAAFWHELERIPAMSITRIEHGLPDHLEDVALKNIGGDFGVPAAFDLCPVVVVLSCAE